MLPSRRVFCAVLMPLVFVCCLVEVSHAGLRAGAARRSIAPPFPTHMGGFGDRKEKFKGVHDDLFVRALVLDDEKTQLAIIGSDLMAIDAEMIELVRAGITKATNIPASHILVSCSHNHSAPSYYQNVQRGEKDPPLKKFLVDQFVEAAVEAYQKRVPARAGFKAGELKGASGNRQQGNEDVIDPQVGVLRVEERDGRQVIAILFNFTAHPVIIGSKNLLLSGEFPGAAERAVENLMGGVAIFTQGACGDVTIHRSGDPFLEIERVGRTLAGEVIKTAGMINPIDTLTLSAASRSLKLAPRVIAKIEDAEAALKQGRAALERAKKNGAGRQIQRALNQKLRLLSANVRVAKAVKAGRFQRPDSIEAEVQVIRVGDLVLVAIPGEIFVEYALELRSRVRQSVGKSMVLVGYANGYVGYIVTPRAIETGGYEASVRRVSAQAGRRMTETAMELLGEVVETAGAQ